MQNSPENNYRHLLAAAITGVSILGVIALAVVIVKTNTEKAEVIFSTLLPVIGTRVGTVLAYYFSKENLEAATAA